MSLFPAFINARKRNADSAPPADPAPESRTADSADDNIFNLLPPESSEDAAPKPKPQGSNRHPVDMTDLSRLSIDRDGRLYWDGKPVETHHRLVMSRRQTFGASIVAILVAIAAIGAVLQGSAAARDWACRLGWTTSTCTLPGMQPGRADIPA